MTGKPSLRRSGSVDVEAEHGLLGLDALPVDEHAGEREAPDHVRLELCDAVDPVDEGRLDVDQDVVVPGNAQRRVETGERRRRLARSGPPGDQNAALGHADGPGMHELTGLVPQPAVENQPQWEASDPPRHPCCISNPGDRKPALPVDEVEEVGARLVDRRDPVAVVAANLAQHAGRVLAPRPERHRDTRGDGVPDTDLEVGRAGQLPARCSKAGVRCGTSASPAKRIAIVRPASRYVRSKVPRARAASSNAP